MFDYPYQKTFVIERGDAGAKAYRDEYVYALEMEIERLRAIIDKLPKTADGVPITPGMRIYIRHPNSDEIHTTRAEPGYTFYCYSTREAAEAAKEEQ